MSFIFILIPMAIALIYLVQLILEAPAFGLIALGVCVIVTLVILYKTDCSFFDMDSSIGKSSQNKTFNRYSEQRASELRAMARGTAEQREEFKKLLGRQYDPAYVEYAIMYIAEQEGWAYYPPGSQHIPK